MRAHNIIVILASVKIEPVNVQGVCLSLNIEPGPPKVPAIQYHAII